MRLEQISTEQKSDYQSFVEANGSFLQSWQWGEFQKSSGQEVLRFMIFDQNNSAVCAAQLIAHPVLGKQYLFSPYGPVFLLSHRVTGADITKVLQFFLREIAKKIANIIFIRLEPYWLMHPETEAGGLNG